MLFITAIRLSGSSAQHITHHKWLNADKGTTGVSPTAEMVKWLRAGNKAQVGGEDGPAYVGLVDGNPPYLRTYADKEWNDNLLALPRF